MGATRLVTAAGVLFAAVVAAQAAAPAAALAADMNATGPALEVSPAALAIRPTALVLTVAKGESSQPAQRRAVLTCQPAGGTHRTARGACTELAKVGGRFAQLQLGGGMCTMQWDPVTVTASGLWKGRKVAYRHTFGNACALATTTGPDFSL
jgi:hypothetical protein